MKGRYDPDCNCSSCRLERMLERRAVVEDMVFVAAGYGKKRDEIAISLSRDGWWTCDWDEVQLISESDLDPERPNGMLLVLICRLLLLARPQLKERPPPGGNIQ